MHTFVCDRNDRDMEGKIAEHSQSDGAPGKDGASVLHIKNMVCDRCIMAVEALLEREGLHPEHIELGTAAVKEQLGTEQVEKLRKGLEDLGFELIDDRKSLLIEQIKAEVIRLVRHDEDGVKVNLSDHLSARFNRDYGHLSRLFSEVTGTTIEKYLIAQKMELAKELLAYGELSLSEIADRLGYSSAAYLSARFKSATGLTPSHFRRMGAKRRKPLDKV